MIVARENVGINGSLSRVARSGELACKYCQICSRWDGSISVGSVVRASRRAKSAIVVTTGLVVRSGAIVVLFDNGGCTPLILTDETEMKTTHEIIW